MKREQDSISLSANYNLWKELKTIHHDRHFSDIILYCSDGVINTNAFILANLNSFWHNLLTLEYSNTDFEIMLLDETVQTVQAFLNEAFAAEKYIPLHNIKNENHDLWKFDLKENIETFCDIQIKAEIPESQYDYDNDVMDTMDFNFNDFYESDIDSNDNEDFLQNKNKSKVKRRNSKRKANDPSQKSHTMSESGAKKWDKSKQLKVIKPDQGFDGDFIVVLSGSIPNQCRIILQRGEIDEDKIHSAFHYICAATLTDSFQLFCSIRRYRNLNKSAKKFEWPLISCITPNEKKGPKKYILSQVHKFKTKTLVEVKKPVEKLNCYDHTILFDGSLKFSSNISNDFKPSLYMESYELDICDKYGNRNTYVTQNFNINECCSVGTLSKSGQGFSFNELLPNATNCQNLSENSKNVLKKERFLLLFWLLIEWIDIDLLLVGVLKCPYNYYKYEKELYDIKIKTLDTMNEDEKAVCDICHKEIGVKMKGLKQKKEHLERVHFICSTCNAQCDNANDLKRHIRSIHENLEFKNCPFEGCEYKYQLKKQLTNHTHVMHGEKVSCSKCGKSYPKLGPRLRTHEKTCGLYDRCTVCQKVISLSQMSWHMKHAHIDKSVNMCPHCGKQLKSKMSLRSHIYDVHVADEDKPHRCQYCGKGFYKPGSKKQHEITHTGERPFQCHFCDARYNDPSMVTQHEKKKHLDEYLERRKTLHETEERQKLQNQ